MNDAPRADGRVRSVVRGPGSERRDHQRSWLTATGAHVVADRERVHDDRTITCDDDGTVYVTDHGSTTAYYQHDGGGSFPRVGHRDAGGTHRLGSGRDL